MFDAQSPEGTSDLLRELEGAIALAYEQTLAAAEHGVAHALEERVAMGQLSFRAEATADGVVVSIADTDRAEQQLPVGAVALSLEGYRSLEAFIARILRDHAPGMEFSGGEASWSGKLVVRFDQRTMNVGLFREGHGGGLEPLWNLALPRPIPTN